MKIVSLGLATYFFAVGIYLLIWPHSFYTQTPGVSIMGAYNAHFIRDVSFSFLVSGAAMAWATYSRIRSLAIFAAAWPLLHGIYHSVMWAQRNYALDAITFSDLILVVLPGFTAFYLALSTPKGDQHV